jgi:hypothetical protein
MKISKESYEKLKVCFMKLKETKSQEIQSHRDFLNAPAYKGDLEKRIRWDMLRACVPLDWLCDQLYKAENLNDTHIDSALKKIIKALGI